MCLAVLKKQCLSNAQIFVYLKTWNFFIYIKTRRFLFAQKIHDCLHRKCMKSYLYPKVFNLFTNAKITARFEDFFQQKRFLQQKKTWTIFWTTNNLKILLFSYFQCISIATFQIIFMNKQYDIYVPFYSQPHNFIVKNKCLKILIYFCLWCVVKCIYVKISDIHYFLAKPKPFKNFMTKWIKQNNNNKEEKETQIINHSQFDVINELKLR